MKLLLNILLLVGVEVKICVLCFMTSAELTFAFMSSALYDAQNGSDLFAKPRKTDENDVQNGLDLLAKPSTPNENALYDVRNGSKLFAKSSKTKENAWYGVRNGSDFYAKSSKTGEYALGKKLTVANLNRPKFINFDTNNPRALKYHKYLLKFRSTQLDNSYESISESHDPVDVGSHKSAILTGNYELPNVQIGNFQQQISAEQLPHYPLPKTSRHLKVPPEPLARGTGNYKSLPETTDHHKLPPEPHHLNERANSNYKLPAQPQKLPAEPLARASGNYKLPDYPPMSALESYGDEWFPDEYKNNHRNLDK